MCVLICCSKHDTTHKVRFVLLNYINVFLLPPLHILFASNDCISASPFPPAVILVLSLITAGAVLSYLYLACIAF